MKTPLTFLSFHMSLLLSSRELVQKAHTGPARDTLANANTWGRKHPRTSVPVRSSEAVNTLPPTTRVRGRLFVVCVRLYLACNPKAHVCLYQRFGPFCGKIVQVSLWYICLLGTHSGSRPVFVCQIFTVDLPRHRGNNIRSQNNIFW